MQACVDCRPFIPFTCQALSGCNPSGRNFDYMSAPSGNPQYTIIRVFLNQNITDINKVVVNVEGIAKYEDNDRETPDLDLGWIILNNVTTSWIDINIPLCSRGGGFYKSMFYFRFVVLEMA